MTYIACLDQFASTFQSTGKFRHNTGVHFKAFPFIANNNSPIVTSLEQVVGRFLCRINDTYPVSLNSDAILDALITECGISQQSALSSNFREIIRHMFFDENKNLRPLNIKMLAHIVPTETSQERVADYLVDVLGNKYHMQQCLKRAHQRFEQQSHVLERAFCDKLNIKDNSSAADIPYSRIINVLQNKFDQDFEFILSSNERTKEYLVQLLEFYYFTYTAQLCLQLDRFENGERDALYPLYFSLDWETTSQNRKCYADGWQRLQHAVKHAFAHAVTLEILNQTVPNCSTYDYISLCQKASTSIEHDQMISEQIKILTDNYREIVADCSEMQALRREEAPLGQATACEMHYLFSNVRTQFENTPRGRVYHAYAEKFEVFAHNTFLKKRGRSGWMLTLSEEMIIFLTRLCVGDAEIMRLNTVFEEFESRGVFLDHISKRKVIDYFEKLNLIEKKSDSGDSMYVKRIL